jgi:hypothetical protein
MLNWKYSEWRVTTFEELGSNLVSTFAMFWMLLYPVYEVGNAIVYY